MKAFILSVGKSLEEYYSEECLLYDLGDKSIQRFIGFQKDMVLQSEDLLPQSAYSTRKENE
jgi:hypothetical protein